MRITHVITGLTMGGAEMAMLQLIEATRGQVEHAVVGLTSRYTRQAEDAIRPRLAALGIPVETLGMRQGIPDPRAIPRLLGVMRRQRPDVVHGWMWHANLLAGLAGRLARVPVVWDVHHADVDSARVSRSSRWTNAASARLSGVLPERIVFRAAAAAASHRGIGYRMERALVIPNGFDVSAFRFDAQAGRRVREELSIPRDAPVVGLLARVHPDKDHGTFLAAARRVLDRRPDAVFLLAGDRVHASTEELARPLDALGLRGSVRLLGLRRDVPAILSSIDVLASSSRTEAFPLVLGEAMACGITCVATDCGDSRLIVGDAGRIVPPGDPDALATAILELLSLSPADRAALGEAARASVCERYDLRVIARRYLELYREVAAER